MTESLFKWSPPSRKQLQLLTWWLPDSPVSDKTTIIADGAVRSGKTLPMSFSFVVWAMETFDGENLGMAGKTIGVLRRNVVQPLKRVLAGRGYVIIDHRGDNYLEITYQDRTNLFYLFGGKDESSQDLIQGLTLAGMYFDEVALMPESFVNQATARCSHADSRLWFNGNPESPNHWFFTKWLQDLERINGFHLHFTMDDNPSLTQETKERFRRTYPRGSIFYKRYILGLWVAAEGVIYDGFDPAKHVVSRLPDRFDRIVVGVDYGTANPTAFTLLGKEHGKNVWYVAREYFYDGRKRQRQKTDAEYSGDLAEFLGEYKHPQSIEVDPSALSFITQLRQDGMRIGDGRRFAHGADNSVLDGIRRVATALETGHLFIHQSCTNLIEEFQSYVWDEKAQQKGEDKPLKDKDHLLDSLRYATQAIRV